jgi:membrane protein required for colicin V production
MNGLDIALAVVVLFFVLRGIFRGFIKEISSILAMVASFFLSSRYFPALSETLRPFIQNDAYRDTLAFLCLFLGVFIILSVLGLIVDKLFKLAVSNVINGILGALTAAVKGLLLCGVVLMGITAFISQDSPFFSQSAAWPYMKGFSLGLKELVPQELKTAIENKKRTLTQQIKPAVPNLSDKMDEPPPWKPVPQPLPADKESSPPQPAWPDGGDGSDGSDQ